MPDKRAHRGAHPEDHRLFDPAQWPRLREAVAEFSWLLTRRYADKSALKLVGDHDQLHQRQRMAVMRCACSDDSLARRRAHHVDPAHLRHQPLLLDA